MKKWFWSNAQGLAALAGGLTLFLVLGPLLHRIDPGAGVVDLGALHVILFGAVKLLAAVSLAWGIISIEFKFLDDYMDSGSLMDDWRDLPGDVRIYVLMGLFVGLILAFAIICG